MASSSCQKSHPGSHHEHDEDEHSSHPLCSEVMPSPFVQQIVEHSSHGAIIVILPTAEKISSAELAYCDVQTIHDSLAA